MLGRLSMACLVLAMVALPSARAQSPRPFRADLPPYNIPFPPPPSSPLTHSMTPLNPPGLYRVPRLFLETTRRPEPDIDYYGRGRLAFYRQRYDEAVRDWRSAVNRDPKDGNLLMQLGLAQFQAGRY